MVNDFQCPGHPWYRFGLALVSRLVYNTVYAVSLRTTFHCGIFLTDSIHIHVSQ